MWYPQTLVYRAGVQMSALCQGCAVASSAFVDGDGIAIEFDWKCIQQHPHEISVRLISGATSVGSVFQAWVVPVFGLVSTISQNSKDETVALGVEVNTSHGSQSVALAQRVDDAELPLSAVAELVVNCDDVGRCIDAEFGTSYHPPPCPDEGCSFTTRPDAVLDSCFDDDGHPMRVVRFVDRDTRRIMWGGPELRMHPCTTTALMPDICRMRRDHVEVYDDSMWDIDWGDRGVPGWFVRPVRRKCVDVIDGPQDWPVMPYVVRGRALRPERVHTSRVVRSFIRRAKRVFDVSRSDIAQAREFVALGGDTSCVVGDAPEFVRPINHGVYWADGDALMWAPAGVELDDDVPLPVRIAAESGPRSFEAQGFGRRFGALCLGRLCARHATLDDGVAIVGGYMDATVTRLNDELRAVGASLTSTDAATIVASLVASIELLYNTTKKSSALTLSWMIARNVDFQKVCSSPLAQTVLAVFSLALWYMLHQNREEFACMAGGDDSDPLHDAIGDVADAAGPTADAMRAVHRAAMQDPRFQQQYGGLRSFTGGLNETSRALNSLMIIEKFCQLVVGYVKAAVMLGVPAPETHVTAARRWLDARCTVPGEIPTARTLHECVEHVERVSPIVLARTGGAESISVLKELRDYRDRAKASLEMATEVKPPYVLYLYGAAGVGKTTLATVLLDIIASAQGKVLTKMDVYDMQLSRKFHLVAGQTALVVDDDQCSFRDPDVLSLFQTLFNGKYKLLNASESRQKEINYIRVEEAVWLSNTQAPNGLAGVSADLVESVERRFTARVHVVANGQPLDLHRYTHLTFAFERGGVPGVLSFAEFVQALHNDARRHYGNHVGDILASRVGARPPGVSAVEYYAMGPTDQPLYKLLLLSHLECHGDSVAGVDNATVLSVLRDYPTEVMSWATIYLVSHLRPPLVINGLDYARVIERLVDMRYEECEAIIARRDPDHWVKWCAIALSIAGIVLTAVTLAKVCAMAVEPDYAKQKSQGKAVMQPLVRHKYEVVPKGGDEKSRSLQKSCGRVWYCTEGGVCPDGGVACWNVRVGDTSWLLTVKHYLRCTTRPVVRVSMSGVTHEFRREACTVVLHPERDLAMISVPHESIGRNVYASFREDDNVLGGDFVGRFVSSEACDVVEVSCPRLKTVYSGGVNGANHTYHLVGGYAYNSTHPRGSCGSLLINGDVIVGLHVAGNGSIGRAEPVSRAAIDEMIAIDADSTPWPSFTDAAKADVAIATHITDLVVPTRYVSRVSEIVPTAFGVHFHQVFGPPQRAPVKLGWRVVDGYAMHPVLNTLANLSDLTARSVKQPDYTPYARIIADGLRVDGVRYEMLTIDKIVRGYCGSPAMNLSHSTGWTSAGVGPKRQFVVGDGPATRLVPKLQSVFETACAMLESGAPVEVALPLLDRVIKLEEKDELRVPGKDSRIIGATPFVLLCLWVRYVWFVLPCVVADPVGTGLGVGLDVHSMQWTEVADGVGEFALCVDCSNFDQSITPAQMRGLAAYYDRLMERVCAPVCAVTAVRSLFAYLCRSMVSYGPLVYSFIGVQWSGTKDTSIGDGVIWKLTAADAVAEITGCDPATAVAKLNAAGVVVYGDDYISAPFVDVSAYASALRARGFNVTSPDKNGDPVVCRIEDAQFLSRGFRRSDGARRYLAPLKMESLSSIPSWKYDKTSDRDYLRSIMYQLCMECWHHGPELYNRNRAVLSEVLNSMSVVPDDRCLLSYDEFTHEMSHATPSDYVALGGDVLPVRIGARSNVFEADVIGGVRARDVVCRGAQGLGDISERCAEWHNVGVISGVTPVVSTFVVRDMPLIPSVFVPGATRASYTSVSPTYPVLMSLCTARYRARGVYVRIRVATLANFQRTVYRAFFSWLGGTGSLTVPVIASTGGSLSFAVDIDTARVQEVIAYVPFESVNTTFEPMFWNIGYGNLSSDPACCPAYMSIVPVTIATSSTGTPATDTFIIDYAWDEIQFSGYNNRFQNAQTLTADRTNYGRYPQFAALGGDDLDLPPVIIQSTTGVANTINGVFERYFADSVVAARLQNRQVMSCGWEFVVEANAPASVVGECALFCVPAGRTYQASMLTSLPFALITEFPHTRFMLGRDPTATLVVPPHVVAPWFPLNKKQAGTGGDGTSQLITRLAEPWVGVAFAAAPVNYLGTLSSPTIVVTARPIDVCFGARALAAINITVAMGGDTVADTSEPARQSFIDRVKPLAIRPKFDVLAGGARDMPYWRDHVDLLRNALIVRVPEAGEQVDGTVGGMCQAITMYGWAYPFQESVIDNVTSSVYYNPTNPIREMLIGCMLGHRGDVDITVMLPNNVNVVAGASDGTFTRVDQGVSLASTVYAIPENIYSDSNHFPYDNGLAVIDTTNGYMSADDTAFGFMSAVPFGVAYANTEAAGSCVSIRVPDINPLYWCPSRPVGCAQFNVARSIVAHEVTACVNYLVSDTGASYSLSGESPYFAVCVADNYAVCSYRPVFNAYFPSTITGSQGSFFWDAYNGTRE